MFAPANNPPQANDVTASATEDGAAVSGSFDADDIDSDDDPGSLTYVITSSPSEGSVVNNNNGTFTFDRGTDFQDLAVGETRDVTFTYTATDSHTAVSNTATVTITVTGVNEAPVIDSLSTTSADENGTVYLTGTYHDVDNQGTHDLIINWGEGAAQTYVVSDGAFNISRQYLDDNPTNSTSDVYTINMMLADDAGGMVTDSTTTTISNVAPTVGYAHGVLGDSLQIGERQVAMPSEYRGPDLRALSTPLIQDVGSLGGTLRLSSQSARDEVLDSVPVRRLSRTSIDLRDQVLADWWIVKGGQWTLTSSWTTNF